MSKSDSSVFSRTCQYSSRSTCSAESSFSSGLGFGPEFIRVTVDGPHLKVSLLPERTDDTAKVLQFPIECGFGTCRLIASARPRMGHHAHPGRREEVPGRPGGHAGLRRAPGEGHEVLQAAGLRLRRPRLVAARPDRPAVRLRRRRVYQCPKKGTGLGRGLLGSDLDELWLIDGSSIRPLAGLHGERPRPPAPALPAVRVRGAPRRPDDDHRRAGPRRVRGQAPGAAPRRPALLPAVPAARGQPVRLLPGGAGARADPDGAAQAGVPAGLLQRGPPFPGSTSPPATRR